jgi:hypothetical protein
MNDNAKSTARRAGDAGSRPARLSPEGAKKNTNWRTRLELNQHPTIVRSRRSIERWRRMFKLE